MRRKKLKEEAVKIPIYFFVDEEGAVFVDEDLMREELNKKIQEIKQNPTKFLN